MALSVYRLIDNYQRVLTSVREAPSACMYENYRYGRRDFGSQPIFLFLYPEYLYNEFISKVNPIRP